MRRVQLTASGLVQGVFFRANTRDEARRLGLTGWISNTPAGTVEAEVQGDDRAVGELIEFCRRGPGRARVDDVVVQDLPVVHGESSFEVR